MTALLAHELAHCRNNDVRRSGLVGNAYRILLNWCDMLDPVRDEDEEFHFLQGSMKSCIKKSSCTPKKKWNIA